MRRAALCIAFALTACPALHDLTGRACTADSDCGENLVCHRNACAAPGSFESVAVDVTSAAAAEGGVDVLPGRLARAATRPGLATFSAQGAVPRAQAAAAGSYAPGGGTADVTELTHHSTLTPLPSARSALAAAWAPGRVYALGGMAMDGTLLAEVLSAPVLPDAGLGAWTAETSLPTARHGLSAVAAAGFVYAIGGETSAGLSSDPLAAPILASGALGTWRAAGHLADGRARGGAAVYDGWLYVAGGTCSGATCTPLRFSLGADGGAGAAQALGDLPPRESAAVGVAGGALHVIGGRLSDGTVLDEVWSLALTEHGVADWLPQSALPAPLWGAAAATLPGGLDVIGGNGADGGSIGQELFASASGQGIGPWSDGPTLSLATEQADAVVWNAAVYVLGGTPNGGPVDSIWRAEPDADGGLTPWTIAGTLPHGGGSGYGALAWGARLYLVGGCSTVGVSNGDCLSMDEVNAYDFLPDGGLGNFRTLSHLMQDTDGPAVAAVNGTLYAAGGVTGYNPTLPTVLKTAIDPVGGGLGAFAPMPPLPTMPGLWGHGMIATRGTLYVVGGETSGGFGGYVDQVLLAPLAADGTVTGWSLAPVTLPEPRSYMHAFGFDDALYAVGGCNEPPGYCSNDLGNVPVATILEDGGLSVFAPSAGELPNPGRGIAIASLNGRLITAGGYDGNPHDWTSLGRLHGRGQLGAPVPFAAAPGTAFAASDVWLFSFGATVQQASLVGGVPGAWMPAPMVAATAAAVLGGRVYAASGTSLSSADIANGITQWQPEPALPEAVTAIAAGDGALYLIAGTDVFVGRPTTWMMATPLPGPVRRALVARQHLFALGGDNGDIFVAPIAGDGSLGDWRRADGLPGPRDDFGVAAGDELLYVAGGIGLSDVMVAPIHPDGALGTWSTVAAHVPAQALVFSHGYLIALADSASVLPALTPPSRGNISARVDLGRVVTIDDIALIATGPVLTQVRLAGDDGAFGDLMPLSAALGQRARGVWLRITLSEDAAVTGLSVATKL